MNKDEFRDLFTRYYNPLCNFAQSIVRDDAKAEDAVQDVFVAMWQVKETITDQEYIKAYLFKATKHKCIEYLRKMVSEQNLKDQMESRIQMSSSINIAEEADNYVLKEKLYNSIRQLPPKTKEVFSLSKLNGLTYSEIADKLNISVKTVENQMGRALRLLREMMKDNLINKK